MCSCNIHLLPSFYCYEKVVDWFNKLPQPRRKYWEADERPLDGPAKHHYRIKKTAPDTYQIILYQTPIVTWHGANKVVVDVSYGGSTTMQFANRYAGFLGRAFREGGQDVFRVDGVKYQTKEPFEFAHVGHPNSLMKEWKLVSLHSKITRQVLDPDKAHEYRQAAAPFKRWARGIWALSNETPDGTNHPWVGQEATTTQYSREDFYAMLSRQEDWPQLVLRFVDKVNTWNQGIEFWGAPTTVKNMLKNMNAVVQQGMYITIPYDAPLPKRTK